MLLLAIIRNIASFFGIGDKQVPKVSDNIPTVASPPLAPATDPVDDDADAIAFVPGGYVAELSLGRRADARALGLKPVNGSAFGGDADAWSASGTTDLRS
jgi:hypothetical protein